MRLGLVKGQTGGGGLGLAAARVVCRVVRGGRAVGYLGVGQRHSEDWMSFQNEHSDRQQHKEHGQEGKGLNNKNGNVTGIFLQSTKTMKNTRLFYV